MKRIQLAAGGVADQLLQDLKNKNSPFAPAIESQQNLAKYYEGQPPSSPTAGILHSMGGALAGIKPGSHIPDLLSQGFAGVHKSYDDAQAKDENNMSNAMKLRIAIADTYKKVEELDFKREMQDMKYETLIQRNIDKDNKFEAGDSQLYHKDLLEIKEAKEVLEKLDKIEPLAKAHTPAWLLPKFTGENPLGSELKTMVESIPKKWRPVFEVQSKAEDKVNAINNLRSALIRKLQSESALKAHQQNRTPYHLAKEEIEDSIDRALNKESERNSGADSE